jgi:hypothetical protein
MSRPPLKHSFINVSGPLDNFLMFSGFFNFWRKLSFRQGYLPPCRDFGHFFLFAFSLAIHQVARVVLWMGFLVLACWSFGDARAVFGSFFVCMGCILFIACV